MSHALILSLQLRGWKPFLHKLITLSILCLLSACRNDHEDDLTQVSFNAVTPLTAVEVEGIIQRSAQALDAIDLSIAVVDRIGNILAVYRRNPATTDADLNKAVSISRAAAFLSSSQGPLSSRTLEFISTFHFPPTFGEIRDLPFSTLTPQRVTTGVDGTSQGPLWQIFTSNRGAPVAGAGLTEGSTSTLTATLYLAGQEIPNPTNIDGSVRTPGLGYLPGGIPLYKNGRVVGGVGCFGTGPNACEYAALTGAGPFAFTGIPDEGAIFLVGILLPYVEQTTRPNSFGPGAYDPADLVDVNPDPGIVETTRDGVTDPFGYLIGPRADPLGNLTLADVDQIINQGIETARNTRAAIRLPLGTTTRMIFTITNLEGLILAIFRMEDAPIFSLDVSLSKARTVTYFSGNSLLAADAIPGIPLGTAISTRTLGFLSQPAFPPTIDGHEPGPLFNLVLSNQDPAQYNRLGSAPASPGLQNGLNFFPGSTPLYKNGMLAGGLGVSGDGVEQDDFVTSGSAAGFLPAASIRADNYKFQGVRLPYFKFPQFPGPGHD